MLHKLLLRARNYKVTKPLCLDAVGLPHSLSNFCVEGGSCEKQARNTRDAPWMACRIFVFHASPGPKGLSVAPVRNLRRLQHGAMPVDVCTVFMHVGHEHVLTLDLTHAREHMWSPTLRVEPKRRVSAGHHHA